MRYPELVRRALCTVPVRLVLYGEDLTEDGEPEVVFDETLFCVWQDCGRAELTERERYIRVTGRAWFPGDICPEVPAITAGWGQVFGQRRQIASGSKARNPDGSVNYTAVRFR